MIAVQICIQTALLFGVYNYMMTSLPGMFAKCPLSSRASLLCSLALMVAYYYEANLYLTMPESRYRQNSPHSAAVIIHLNLTLGF